MKIEFNNLQVAKVSKFLQSYMEDKKITMLTADECAEILNTNNLLSNKIGPKPGFHFREMLRQGRDNKINLVTGASQLKPNARWSIHNTK